MKIFNCFAGFISKNTNKGNSKPQPPRTQRIIQIRLQNPVKPLKNGEPNIGSYNKSLDHKNSPVEHDSHEHHGKHSKNRELPKLEIPERDVESWRSKELGKEVTDCSENVDGDDEESGHVSDPGLGRVNAWVASPKLKRSCSNLSKVPTGWFHGSDPQDLHELRQSYDVASVKSHRSADRVMLKKHSSMQILPSGSRRLWWKLFLWSHRNLHKHRLSLKSQPLCAKTHHRSGYTSEHDQEVDQSSDLWPRRNQWVAFSSESPSMKRVDEWIKGLHVVETAVPVNKDEDKNKFRNCTASPKIERSPSGNVSEEIVHANNLIQSLSKASSMAHISHIGLKAIPSISHFTSLKSIDLSNNYIVQITPASLPKGLQALNLSKNKISVIEGLRDLTRLRMLDLSYNRISRIGQSLSNCTRIKELYLAGNKISDVEGLHRLLKLMVLDLGFNKIPTIKAIGQLVANYNSLVALNILGNPIQSNFGVDHLRKTVTSLLPKLVYFNKQLIKPQRAKEVLKHSIAKAAFGGGDSMHHRGKKTATKRTVVLVSPRGRVGDDKKKRKGRGSKGRSEHQRRKTSTAETPSQ